MASLRGTFLLLGFPCSIKFYALFLLGNTLGMGFLDRSDSPASSRTSSKGTQRGSRAPGDDASGEASPTSGRRDKAQDQRSASENKATVKTPLLGLGVERTSAQEKRDCRRKAGRWKLLSDRTTGIWRGLD